MSASGPSLRIHVVTTGEMLLLYTALEGAAKVHGMRPGAVTEEGHLEILLYGNKKVEVECH